VSGINAAKGAIAAYGVENDGPAAATIHYDACSPTVNVLTRCFSGGCCGAGRPVNCFVSTCLAEPRLS
jgi:hypothetical protein